ncbi:MAG: response regulator [Opitutaceae bacterium]|nr:response regulator [Opitutaceae bacterium]
MMVLLDQEMRVRRMNLAAMEFAEITEADAGNLSPGRILGCIEALHHPEGCGHGPSCPTCPLRTIILDTLQHGAIHRRVKASPALIAGKLAQEKTVLASTAPLTLHGEKLLLLYLEDITEQEQLARQLRQSQKMDAFGQLAGGVAHDFNNILTAFQMSLDLLKLEPGVTPKMTDQLEQLALISNRAGDLTRQLLMFSRKQPVRQAPHELNQLIDTLLKMLRRLLGENIAIEFKRSDRPCWIVADQGMIEQVVMNLCVNARDAMPDGGRLMISTEATELTSPMGQAHPGAYAVLRVADTGTGMSDQVKAHIFEPFFTTKEVGKGTGLGLATVFGIVQQHQGAIAVESAPGQGTQFSIFLPLTVEPDPSRPGFTLETQIPGRGDAILLVEDDPHVRIPAAQLLSRLGYRVTAADCGAEALQRWAERNGAFDLLISDVIMPGGMSGWQLAARLRESRPALPVIITSGYDSDPRAESELTRCGYGFVRKPYASMDLAAVVQTSLHPH